MSLSDFPEDEMKQSGREFVASPYYDPQGEHQKRSAHKTPLSPGAMRARITLRHLESPSPNRPESSNPVISGAERERLYDPIEDIIDNTREDPREGPIVYYNTQYFPLYKIIYYILFLAIYIIASIYNQKIELYDKIIDILIVSILILISIIINYFYYKNNIYFILFNIFFVSGVSLILIYGVLNTIRRKKIFSKMREFMLLIGNIAGEFLLIMLFGNE